MHRVLRWGDRFEQIAATEKCQALRSSSEARMDEGCVKIHKLDSSADSLVIVTLLMIVLQAIWQSPQRNK
jgi:hypothetical protein